MHEYAGLTAGAQQSAGDIANLIFKSASVLTSMITAFGITVLQGQIAGILSTIEEIETVDGTQTIQLNTLNSDTWFLTSSMTSIGIRKPDFTENQTILSDSVLCVRDFSSKTTLRVDGPNHSMTVACPLDITYDGSTSLTSINSSVNVNGTFTHTGKTSTLSSYVSTGNINCNTGLSIVNLNANKISQNFKVNASNANLFNQYDT